MWRKRIQLYVKRQKDNEVIFYFITSCLPITKKLLFWIFWRWKIWYFRAKKLMEIWYLLITKMFLSWSFREWEIRSFFVPKSWWKDRTYWLLKRPCFEQEVDRKMIFTGYWKVLVLNLSCFEGWYLLGLLSFPGYSRTWEIWFFAQWLNRFVFLLFLVFSEDDDLQPVFRRYSWCFSSLIIFSWSLMLILEILVLTVFTSLDSTIESSEILILHVDSLSLFSWGTSKSHVSPAILQLLLSRISLLRSFLIISFFFERNSIFLSRLIISFLSTTV